MPLYALCAPDGCHAEEFCHCPEDKGARTHVCPHGEAMVHVLSVGAGITYFEEGRARVIENLTHEPVVVRSHREHERLMRQHGVTWGTQGVGRRGCWV